MAVWFLCALFINRFPGGLWWWLLLGVAIDFLLIVLYPKRAREAPWYFYFPWFFGAYASLFLFMFLDRSFLRYVWLISVAMCGMLYWYRLNKWMNSPAEQESRISMLGILWLAFGAAAGGITLYAWQIFVGQNAWVVALWVLALVSAATFTMWKLKDKVLSPEIFLHIAVLILVAFEFFWVVGFTTFGFASKGYIWAIGVWYSWWLSVIIQKNKIKIPAVLKSTGLLFANWLIVLFLTRWF